jgi:hypothetical protein
MQMRADPLVLDVIGSDEDLAAIQAAAASLSFSLPFRVGKSSFTYTVESRS